MDFQNLTLDDVKNLSTILSLIVAILAFLKGLFEYRLQGKQKRAEQFFNLRERLKENEIFKEICFLLENDDIRLKEIPFKDKRDFLGLFEEVAIMKNSSLIKKEIAFYMFGYYAIRCWNSHYFWSSVNKESFYWAVFKTFALEMKKIELEGNVNVSKIRV